MAMLAGAAMAVVGNEASRSPAPDSSHLAIPLGLTAATLGAILPIAYLSGRFSQPAKREPAPVGGVTARAPAKSPAKSMDRRSVAMDLALLSKLHSRGVLSQAEFDKAKKRVLGD